jgi:hypothetical protein
VISAAVTTIQEAEETVTLEAEAKEEAKDGGITGVGRKAGTNQAQDLVVARS